MAVTKIKPIRGTVNKALAYILDPQKTDDAFYVSSYGCAASDAAAKEFEWTRNLAVQQGMQMPKVLARHLIQSFDIGEVTPEEAHEVGKQLADEWLKGKYEYVIATHIDKGHCHNHIIFNAVNYVDFHAYRSNKRTYRELRQLSDEICKEHGLSVSGQTTAELLQHALSLLQDARLREEMCKKQRLTINPHAAATICDYILKDYVRVHGHEPKI